MSILFNGTVTTANPLPVTNVGGSGSPSEVIQPGEVSTGNTSSTPLAAGAVFTGTWSDSLNFGTLVVGVHTDQSSAVDGLQVQYSQDQSLVADRDVFTISANTGKVFSFTSSHRYFRVVYTNGAVDQTDFELTTIQRKYAIKPSSHRIQDAIIAEDDAELVKAVLSGSTDNNGFINYSATNKGNFKVAVQEYGDTPSIDAFDRLRVSNPYTLFDSKQLHDKQPLFWDEQLLGSATSTHSTSDARVRMAVTADSGDSVIRQTKQRFNYQPGKGQLILMTFLATQETGATKRIGLFDGTGANYLTPNNGIFLEVTESGVSWNICKNGITTETITQANWNVDPLDGTGYSTVNLDLDATQIAIIDYEWLGVGRVRVGFVVNGIIRYCHYFNHSNDSTFTSVYMSTPNLPLRYMITTDGSSTASLDHICSSVMSEGGLEQTGVLRSVDSGTSELDAATGGTTYVLIGLKLKSNYIDITVLPEFFSMINTTGDDYRWELCLNPTVAGSLSYSDVTSSAVQYAVGSSSNTVSDRGLVIDSGYVIAGGANGAVDRKFVTSLRMGSNIDGTLDELALCVTPLTNGADVYGSLTFRELL
jgi:hypothetical protein